MKLPLLGKYLESRGQNNLASRLADKYGMSGERDRYHFTTFTKRCLQQGLALAQIEFYLQHPVDHGEYFSTRTWRANSVNEQILGRLYGLGEMMKDLNTGLKEGRISRDDYMRRKSYFGTVEYTVLVEASGLRRKLLKGSNSESN